jgi:tetratricopeptide (TPR) repeat protein
MQNLRHSNEVCRVLAICLLVVPVIALAQGADDAELARVKTLFQQQRWQEIIATARPGNSPEVAFYYGTAQARLGHWAEAAQAFNLGRRLAPQDPRFPVELAGVAFKQKDYPEAENWLRKATRLDPGDSYIKDFLATVFFLEGNVEAALKYWNAIDKPHINRVTAEPAPRLDPVLFDRALALSPASTLGLSDFLASGARLDQLHIFPASHLEIVAREDGTFDLVFRNFERNGCGGKWGCLLTVLGQSPGQTLNFDYYNLGRRAVNFSSLWRWDAEKRRIGASVEFPFARQPKWHLRTAADLRNENWAMRSAFSGPAPLLAALNLKREAGSLEFTDVVSGRWRWSAATEFSRRSFHKVLPGTTIAGTSLPEFLIPGSQLKQSLGAQAALLSIPEHRLSIVGLGSVSVARLWSGKGHQFSSFQGTSRSSWLPQHSGDKFEIQHAFRAAKTFGSPPFDELHTLGVLGDTDLLIRAHIATRDGKKGSAPIGRNYFVSNLDATRNFSLLGVFKIKLGPFLDTGWTNNLLAQPEWLWDAGAQVRVQVLGFDLAASYGRDLRSGTNAFVVRVP